jgi:hypothetical protein
MEAMRKENSHNLTQRLGKKKQRISGEINKEILYPILGG